jgi:protein SCO1
MSKTWQRTSVGVAVAALAVGATGCGASGGSHTARPAHGRPASAGVGQVVPAGTATADFALRDQHGDLVRLSGQRGRVTILTFLYTHCVDVCPLIATQLNAVLQQLGSDRTRTRVLAVSVDPRFDTRKAIRQFIAERRLLPEFHYLHGTAAELKPVWQAYNILVVPKNPDVMAHTASITLIDRSGKARIVYPATASASDILPATKRLLRG